MIVDIKKDNLRILVTGGAGFIGGCLVRRLLNISNAIIFNLDKLSYASDLSWIKTTCNIENHTLIKADLNNYDETLSAVNKANPDIIFHLAAESHVDRSIENARPFIESNILGTFNILESARLHWDKLELDRKERFRFLHVSTDEVFGSLGEEGKFSEGSPYDPRSPYSASKAASDHICNAWFHTFDFPVIKTNCSNNFGPFQFPEKLIPLTITNILRGKEIPVYGDGLNIRDWLFVEDHCSAIDVILHKAKPGSTYCIGGNNELRNIDLINQICVLIDEYAKKLNIDLTKNKSSDLISFVDDRLGHDKRYSIKSEKLLNELNWKPKIKFKDGIKITVKWYLTNFSWWEPIIKINNH